MMSSFFRAVATIRWKLYKLAMRLSLGKIWGWGIDKNLVYFIPESCVTDDVAIHVCGVHRISDAYIQKYDVPSSLSSKACSRKIFFCEAKAVPVRNMYYLSRVAVSAETGAVWVPGKCAFVESLGNNVHFYAWGGLIDMMCRPLSVLDMVITPCANLGYYHWLLDAMAQVLIARNKAGANVKVLVSSHASRFVKDGLRFFGIEEDDIIYADRPVKADRVVLVARNNDLGVIFKDNIDVLRMEIAKHCDADVLPFRKIYISRRLEQNRAIQNEEQVEDVVREAGFEICYFERMSFPEQMKVMSEAKVVMGIHGAGLSNIIAGKAGLKVIELLNPTWFNTCFSQLASQLGFEYCYDVLKQDGDAVYADISEVKRLLLGVGR